MLLNWQLFKEPFDAGGYSVHNLQQVLTGDAVQWDLVNAGGMDKTIISVLALCMIFILSFQFSQNKKLAAAGAASIFVLVGICCKGTFLGWYLMPMIYIVSVCVPEADKMFLVILFNLAVIFPGIHFQIVSKLNWMKNMEHMDDIKCQVRAWEEQEQYDGYEKYYFVEIGGLPMFPVFDYAGETSEKRLLFISGRARLNEQIDWIYKQSLYNLDGHRIEDETDSLAFIVYERPAE